MGRERNIGPQQWIFSFQLWRLHCLTVEFDSSLFMLYIKFSIGNVMNGVKRSLLWTRTKYANELAFETDSQRLIVYRLWINWTNCSSSSSPFHKLNFHNFFIQKCLLTHYEWECACLAQVITGLPHLHPSWGLPKWYCVMTKMRIQEKIIQFA